MYYPLRRRSIRLDIRVARGRVLRLQRRWWRWVVELAMLVWAVVAWAVLAVVAVGCGVGDVGVGCGGVGGVGGGVSGTRNVSF